MNVSAPYSSATGSHTVRARNDQPNFSMDGLDPSYISYAMRTTSRRTTAAKASVMYRKTRSPTLRRRAPWRDVNAPVGPEPAKAPPGPALETLTAVSVVGGTQTYCVFIMAIRFSHMLTTFFGSGA